MSNLKMEIMETLKTQIVEFHIGRGGRYYNQGHLTFHGVGCSLKQMIESEECLSFENMEDVVRKNEEDEPDIVNMINELSCDDTSGEYKAFCEKYGDLGGIVLQSCSGNYIGDYVPDGDEYHYDIDGEYDTSYGTSVESFEDLSEREQRAVLESENRWEFEQAFCVELAENTL